MGDVVLGPGSAWVTDDGYDPAEFYCKAVDGKGHSAWTRVRIPPDRSGEIAALVASKQFPYRTAGDFVRDAIAHRLHYLMNHAPTPEAKERITHLLSGILTEERIAGVVLELQRQIAQVEALEELAKSATDLGDAHIMEQVIYEARALADETREPYISRLDDLAQTLERKLRTL